mmetsp:Transcript_27786/g.41204  ORF Transcript_27786/g.41204 Transcript_27786/m.41204 type:complete len:349 (-) Transcript_27786:1624-2670(-)
MAPKPQEEDVPDEEPAFAIDTEGIGENQPEEEEKECPLTKAELLYGQDKVSKVKTVLESVDPAILDDKHRAMLARADEAEALVKDMKAKPEGGDWIDQGISRGKYPTRILYRLEEGENKTELRARCETPIKKDLLESLFCVLNETELYETWFPSFSVPRFKIRECRKLKQIGRVSQILFVVMELPWPIAAREIVLSAAAFDDIEDKGHIGIKMKTIETEDDETVPEATSTAVRVDLDGGFLFEACPADHPAMKYVDKEDGEEYLLVTFSALVNPNMKNLPQSFLNFFVKIALGTCWKMLLKIAQDVKDGKRPDHANAMIKKREELYDYIKGRVVAMLSTLKSAETITP